MQIKKIKVYDEETLKIKFTDGQVRMFNLNDYLRNTSLLAEDLDKPTKFFDVYSIRVDNTNNYLIIADNKGILAEEVYENSYPPAVWQRKLPKIALGLVILSIVGTIFMNIRAEIEEDTNKAPAVETRAKDTGTVRSKKDFPTGKFVDLDYLQGEKNNILFSDENAKLVLKDIKYVEDEKRYDFNYELTNRSLGDTYTLITKGNLFQKDVRWSSDDVRVYSGETKKITQSLYEVDLGIKYDSPGDLSGNVINVIAIDGKESNPYCTIRYTLDWFFTNE